MKIEDRSSEKHLPRGRSVANAAFGAAAAGLAGAAVAGAWPIALALGAAGGLTGYMLTNDMPDS